MPHLQLFALHLPPGAGHCSGVEPADPEDPGRLAQSGNQRGDRADQQALPQHPGAPALTEGVPSV